MGVEIPVHTAMSPEAKRRRLEKELAAARLPQIAGASLSPTITLASGHQMPMVAFGTWKSAPGVTAEAVKIAVRAGYRNLDCANDYNNEHEVGKALKELFAAGEVTRQDLFIQAKLWNSNHRPEHVIQDLQQTLKDLGVEYLDSFVIHWPQACPSSGAKCSTRLDGAHPDHHSTNAMFPLDDDGYFCADKTSHFVETWHAMEDLVEKGLVRSIGLSNFNKAQIAEVLKNVRKHPVSLLQNECHPYLQQKDLIDYCRCNGIAFQAFSPLGSGDTHLAVHSSPTGVIPLKDPFIQGLAQKYSKDAGQIMLRWNFQRGVCVATKSVSEKRIQGNFQLFSWDIAAEDMTSFEAINYGWRHLLWRETSHHPDYPFKDELPHDYVLEKPPKASSSGTSA